MACCFVGLVLIAPSLPAKWPWHELQCMEITICWNLHGLTPFSHQALDT